MSAALHRGSAWHQGEEKQDKDGHQLPPLGDSCSPVGTPQLRPQLPQLALPILLRGDPLCAATISGLLFYFYYLSTKWNHYDAFVSYFLIELAPVLPIEMK